MEETGDPIDKLVDMALQGGNETDEDNDEYLSASEGENDDRKISEWAESLPSDDTDTNLRSATAQSQADTNGRNTCVEQDDNVDRNMCKPASGVGVSSRHESAGGDSVNRSDDEMSDHVHNDSAAVGSNDSNTAKEGNTSGCEGDGNKTDKEEEKADESDSSDDEEEVEKEQTPQEKEAEDKEKQEERKRQEVEDALTEEERQERLAEAVKVKTSGNEAFKSGQYVEALQYYSQALSICPLKYVQQRSIMLSNRAACRMKEENYDAAVKDCSKAIELQPSYIKALNRRADAYEKLEKLEDALKDHHRIIELDRTQGPSFQACMRLENEIKERNEKMKAEMLGKLKELGNMVLRPFGLSTNNFQMNQDPNSGSYSMQFVPTPPTNGK